MLVAVSRKQPARNCQRASPRSRPMRERGESCGVCVGGAFVCYTLAARTGGVSRKIQLQIIKIKNWGKKNNLQPAGKATSSIDLTTARTCEE